MKTYIQYIPFILIALLALNCTHDEKLLLKNNVQFTITTLSTDHVADGRISTTVLPDSVYVSVSVETPTGIPIYSLKHIEVLKLGDDYITAPLDLVAGSYRLTDFMIVSKNDEVLYATPKVGSSLAAFVDNPLPLNFTIIKS